MRLDDMIRANSYESRMETCSGCSNHCQVRLFRFANGKTFASGNNCEKVYSSFKESAHRGTNMVEEKWRMLFGNRPEWQQTASGKPTAYPLRVGLPRALGMYENYPFWRTLLEQCGIEVVLSDVSTAAMYEKGVQTLMADNICFPAKLMHGHILNLMEKMQRLSVGNDIANRILYPYVVYEQKEDTKSKNSFNCPIVSAYSDVIRSAVDPEGRYGIGFDSPVINFSDEGLLRASCTQYLLTLGIDPVVASRAVSLAITAQSSYMKQLEARNLAILREAEAAGRMVILLAGRPYHSDPLIEHKISYAIADMGIDVVTEHIALHKGEGVYDELNAVTQWAYPNRLFKAAYFAGRYSSNRLQMVELTSFGCGPDAFILDEVQSVLNRSNKNLTILKIDDVNNIGSLRLRVRSLVESVRDDHSTQTISPLPFETTKVFEVLDKKRTILAPYFAEGYSELVEAMVRLAGYNLVTLPMGSQADAETGLRYANNDVCYPATIVIGSIMNALNSGRYDLQNTAVLMTQTGGQCRATNYYALIKNAMVEAGYKDVPLISLATSGDVQNKQPGFKIDYKYYARLLVHTMAYADGLNRLYHSAAVRVRKDRIENGKTGKQTADRIRQKYLRIGCEAIERNDTNALLQAMKEATEEFTLLIDRDKRVPVIGLVGEIYVKYNSFSHKGVVNWLLEQEVEVVPPSILDFFSTSFVSRHANRDLNIRRMSMPVWVSDLFYRMIRHIVRRYDRIGKRYPFYRESTGIFHIADLSKQVISTAADFGEGWMLPGEICHLAETGVKNIVSLQPFGCIANHVISKGIEKKLRSIYPDVNMLFLDFDSSTSDANVYNRLHFLVDNARKAME